KVGLIISTTKGNIDVLEKESSFPKSRAYLSELGKTIQNFFGFKNETIVLSNACVSGVLAISVAKR
ncbi:MAG TPA: beta-ketoacyl synthase, partial [Aequorivita sp.]|nr:beta-ketoacyl synthase [Aequorivita sp.]